jgi:hypothetical protein
VNDSFVCVFVYSQRLNSKSQMIDGPNGAAHHSLRKCVFGNTVF